MPGRRAPTAPVHSPGPHTGTTRSIYPSMQGSVPPQGRDQSAIGLPAFVFEPRYLHPYSPSDSRHPLTSRDAPTGAGVHISVKNVPGARYYGDRDGPHPWSWATRHNRNPMSLAMGIIVARLWRSLNSGGCRTAHHCSANHFFFVCFLLSHVPCPMSLVPCPLSHFP